MMSGWSWVIATGMYARACGCVCARVKLMRVRVLARVLLECAFAVTLLPACARVGAHQEQGDNPQDAVGVRAPGQQARGAQPLYGRVLRGRVPQGQGTVRHPAFLSSRIPVVQRF